MNTVIDISATMAISGALATLELAAINDHSPMVLLAMMFTLLASGGWIAGYKLRRKYGDEIRGQFT